MTEKENYFKVMNGEQPEWLPHFTFGGSGGKTPTAMVSPRVFTTQHAPGVESKDCWGVTYVPADSAAGGKIPKPNDFILRDIRDWREVIKLPDLSEYDFEAEAKEQLAKIDRNETAVIYDLNAGVFQLLMSFMGFNEGLMAMFEEPEECAALFEYLADFYCGCIEKCIDFYKPDIFTMMDDTAAWANPFISMNMYKEFLLPLYDRQASFARDRGIPITFHNCGKCQGFMEEVHKIGVVCWDPAQECNDLKAFKAKYGNSYVIAGGWINRDSLLAEGTTDEQIYESVRETINAYGGEGGYMWCGGFLGAKGDERIAHMNKVVREAVKEIGATFYQH